MISYQQALEMILRVIQPLASERLPLTAAYGRVVATSLVAPYAMPPFDQSMVDGYALRSSDTRTATPAQPVRLALGQTLTAGESLEQPLAPWQAMRIMTGASLPRGANTVIKMEESQAEAGMLLIHQPLPRGLYVQRCGAEIRRRSVVLRQGDCLTPQRIGVALSLGMDSVEVIRRPRLALVAPGDELLPPGAPWQPGKKWCSNVYALDMRAEELFSGVATSPGRSVTVARCGQTLIVGLPGSPWAAFVGFEVFVWPALRAMLHQRPARPVLQTATLATPLQVRPGVTYFIPARLQPHATGWLALPIENLLRLARAESHPLGLIIVPPHRRCLQARSRVRVQPITP